MYVYLYKTTNRINDKYYIGIHKTNLDPLKHWDGYLGSGTLISHAINKYGKKAFDHQLLAIFGSREMACDAERAYIATCIDDPNCYNLAPGGDGQINEIFDDWYKRDPQGFIASMKQCSIRSRENALKGWAKEGHKERMSQLMKQLYISNPEQRLVMSEASKKVWADPEHRKKMHKIQKAAHNTPKFKEKQSKIFKEIFKDPMARQKVSEGVRKAPMSEKNLRDALKRCNIKIDKIIQSRKNYLSNKYMREAQLNRRRLETLLDLPHTPFTHVDLVSPRI